MIRSVIFLLKKPAKNFYANECSCQRCFQFIVFYFNIYIISVFPFAQIFTGRDGDRVEASDVVILVADGGAHDLKEAQANAAKLKQRGVQIVTIYIPNSTSDEDFKDDLRNIASSSDDFYTSDFNELKYIAADLVKVVCSSKS